MKSQLLLSSVALLVFSWSPTCLGSYYVDEPEAKFGKLNLLNPNTWFGDYVNRYCKDKYHYMQKQNEPKCRCPNTGAATAAEAKAKGQCDSVNGFLCDGKCLFAPPSSPVIQYQNECKNMNGKVPGVPVAIFTGGFAQLVCYTNTAAYGTALNDDNFHLVISDVTNDICNTETAVAGGSVMLAMCTDDTVDGTDDPDPMPRLAYLCEFTFAH